MNEYPKEWASLNVALAHDWLTGMRGGERVLEIFADGFPDASIHTLIHDPAAVSASINRHPIVTSPLQRVPGITRRYRYFLPVHPWAISRLRAAPADLLISTSHCVAKGLPRPPGARHLCYCFTPMRYAWTFYEEYFGSNPVKKALLKPVLKKLRRWDHDNSARVDRFVAISQHVKRRIEKFYGRDADVVYPPVDTERCTPGPDSEHQGYDLVVSALVPYKRVDLAVQAYRRNGFPLMVVGSGTEYETLRAQATDNITFCGWKSDAEILELYRGCRMLIFPGEEDFGIVPVEAQACGKPVVAFGRGGATETVLDGQTGLFFHEQTSAALIEAIEKCAARKWNPQLIRHHSLKFSTQQFIDGIHKSIHQCLHETDQV
jgi:glycosyltransferase involved in cell wall biosynthesis